MFRSRKAETSGPERNRNHLRWRFFRRNNGCGIGPTAALDIKANRHCGKGIGNFEIALVEIMHRLQLPDQPACLLLLSCLEIRIDQVIHRM